MSKYLRQSTASQEIMIGRCVDSVDGNTEKTALTIANTDIKLFKEGATSLVSKNSGGGTHSANGLYSAVLDATDTNTLGQMKAYVHVSGMLSWEDSWTVLPANVYDSLVLGTDLLDISVVQNNGSAITQTGGRQEVNVTHYGGTAGTFASGRPEVNTTHAAGVAWASGAITAASIASGAITSAKFAASAIDATAIATGAITSAKFAASAIDATAIASNAITSAKIAAGAITNTQFATGAIDTNALAGSAITAGKIATGAISNTKFAAGAIDSAAIAADAIGSSQLAASAVTEIQTGLALALDFQIRSNTAQSGSTASTIRLDAGASALNTYRLCGVWIKSGTGAGQSRVATAYNGTTKDLTVEPDWDIVPDNTSVFVLVPFGAELATLAAVADAVWDKPVAENQLVDSRGECLPVDMIRLSGDSAAADELESIVDGSGAAIPADARKILGGQIVGDGITTLFTVLPAP